MMNNCEWLHHQLEVLPLFRYHFRLQDLPNNGIYFFYENGETCRHNKQSPRIVRIGTHRNNNFRNRINDHYLLNETKMNFDIMKPAPKDRSIFRKNLGRALLNKYKDNYLNVWEIDFTPRGNRERYNNIRDVLKEKEIENEITNLLRKNFSFRLLIMENQDERLGTKGIESSLIVTVARCKTCEPSSEWLGSYSPIKKIVTSGLWQTQHLSSPEINEYEQKDILKSIQNTQEWIRRNNI